MSRKQVDVRLVFLISLCGFACGGVLVGGVGWLAYRHYIEPALTARQPPKPTSAKAQATTHQRRGKTPDRRATQPRVSQSRVAIAPTARPKKKLLYRAIHVLGITSARLAGANAARKSPSPSPVAVAGARRLIVKRQIPQLDPTRGFLLREKLVAPAEVLRYIKTKRPMTLSFLEGIPRSPLYDALLFTPRPLSAKKSPHYGLGIQLWRTSPSHPARQLAARWHRYLRSLPQQTQTIPWRPQVRTFSAQRKQIRYLVALLPKKEVLLTITCHQRLCTDAKMLQIAAQLDRRLTRQARGM